MDLSMVLIFAGVAGVGSIGTLFWFLFNGSGGRDSDLRGLMGSRSVDYKARAKELAQSDEDLDVEKIKKVTGSARAKDKKDDVSTKLFKAGYYSAADRKRFLLGQITSGAVATVLFPTIMAVAVGNGFLTFLSFGLGAMIGLLLPLSWLERKIRAREEDTMYYLPLAIEQVSIGVSSSLDIGPCISNIVEMATERDSHNPVTEMFVHVEKLMRSGLNLEDALIEVGEANGMTEVKHCFMFLAQCSKHGGEISKQLQELADSVMVQRQVQVEAKITSLPVKATGPLAMVFAGFFGLLFAGLLVRLLGAFGGGVGQGSKGV